MREKNTIQIETERAKLRNSAKSEILDMLLSTRAEVFDYIFININKIVFFASMITK